MRTEKLTQGPENWSFRVIMQQLQSQSELSPFLYVPLNIVFEFCINTELQKLK